MMYPRLKLARDLLQEEGLIFVSIDDGEHVRLAATLDEIFGPENFVANFIWKRKAGGGDDSGHVAAEHEYVVCYARDLPRAGVAAIQHESPAMTAKYNRSENGRRYYLERLDKTSLTYSPSMDFEIECPDGTKTRPPQPDPRVPTTIWRWSRSKVEERRQELVFDRDNKTNEWRIYTKTMESLDGVTPRSLLVDTEHGRNRDGTQELAELLGTKVFNNPKPLKLLGHLLSIGAKDKDAVVCDFFAGSGSTGHALFRQNLSDAGHRRFILVQLPEPLHPDDSRERAATEFCDNLGKPRTISRIDEGTPSPCRQEDSGRRHGESRRSRLPRVQARQLEHSRLGAEPGRVEGLPLRQLGAHQGGPEPGRHPLRAAAQARPRSVRAHRAADHRRQDGPQHRRRRADGLPRREDRRARTSSRWRWASSSGTRSWPRPARPPASSATAPSPTTWPRRTSRPSSSSTAWRTCGACRSVRR